MLTLGGADGGNLTAKVMDALALLKDRAFDVQVLAGPLNPHIDALHRHAAATPNMQIRTDVSDPSPLMAWADIAIAAAGTTAWELAFMQTPALLLVAAPNQTDVADGVAEFAAGQSLGRAEDLRRNDIAVALRQLIDDPARRRLMAERGKNLVDGGGPARVLAAMHERQSFNRQSEFTIRRAGAWRRVVALAMGQRSDDACELFQTPKPSVGTFIKAGNQKSWHRPIAGSGSWSMNRIPVGSNSL